MFRSKGKRNYPEQEEQIKFFDHLRKFHPKYERVCFSIPNEGERTYAALKNMMKAGLTPGILDTFCPIPTKSHPGLFIEFKYGSGKLSLAQKEMIPLLEDMGYQCNVCYTAAEAVDIFNKYISNI
jgi:hypothetical protein